ncbi:MAG: hypothetical protein U0269_32570 [Polyangiales bacterium]
MLQRRASSIKIPTVLAYVVIHAGCAPSMPGRDGGDVAQSDATASDGAACVAFDPGAVSPPPAGTRPVVDIAPCPSTMANMGGTATCTTASGCDVIYDSMDSAPLTPSYVSCRVTDGRCLVTFNAAGEPQFVPCPTLDVPNARCNNNYSLREIAQSNFTCGASGTCTVDSAPGMLYANVQRSVDGMLSQTPCPTQCAPFV